MKTNIYATKIVHRLICIAIYTPKHRMKIHIVERCDIVVCVNLHPCVESQSITNENNSTTAIAAMRTTITAITTPSVMGTLLATLYEARDKRMCS